MGVPPLLVSDDDRVELEGWVRARTLDARYAQRARIVLLAADGVSNLAIGDILGMHCNQIAVWRRRYVEFGVDGLDDPPRPGHPPVYDHNDVILLVKTLTEPPPDPATAGRWTCSRRVWLNTESRSRRRRRGGSVRRWISTVADRELD